jgi:hypothetical protein
MDQIELKDASKANKDKSESVKITLLNQELTRASVKPEFLSYFGEVCTFDILVLFYSSLDFAKHLWLRCKVKSIRVHPRTNQTTQAELSDIDTHRPLHPGVKR